MVDRSDDAFALEGLTSRKVPAGLRGHNTISVHIEVGLELLREVILEELPRSLRGAFDGVAGFFVH
jgi:hypothetical protein